MRKLKVLYLTMESLDFDPIIRSQVVPLINVLSSNKKLFSKITLLTFEKAGHTLNEVQLNTGVEHISLIRCSNIYNQITLCRYIYENAYSYDVIHVRSYLPMVSTILLKKRHNCKIIFDPRGLYADEVLYYGDHKFLGYLFKLLERYFYNKSDNIVTVSSKFKKYLIERYFLEDKKITTIETFSSKVNIQSLESSNMCIRRKLNWEDKTVLCYSGSLEAWQLFERVLEFFSLAEKNSDRFRFVFFSKSKPSMELLVSKVLPKNKYVVISAEPHELGPMMYECDYGFLFREAHLINQVSAPIKFNDYLLSGLSIVLTDGIGDSTCFINKTGLGIVIDDFSTSTYIDVISQLHKRSCVEKAETIERVLTERGLQYIAQKYLQLYSTI
ncbi:glycosyltransferase [Aeromonas veronii]|nr:glycosyltransferase [Aeromonas veronii]